MEQETLPLGSQLTPFDEEFRNNPYRMLETLKRDASNWVIFFKGILTCYAGSSLNGENIRHPCS